MSREKEDLQKEEEEKKQLLELMKMQNEALKRIYNKTISKKNNH